LRSDFSVLDEHPLPPVERSGRNTASQLWSIRRVEQFRQVPTVVEPQQPKAQHDTTTGDGAGKDVLQGDPFRRRQRAIQPRSESVIGGIAQYMHETPSLRFEVQGHTDSDGGAAYNLGLSQRRAQAVVDDLVAHHGIARSRLKAKGYGLSQPVAPNTTAAGKALNRRVELLRL